MVSTKVTMFSTMLFDAHQMQYPTALSNGLFGYFAVASAVYLLIRRNTRFLIPGFWFVSTFLYMGLGTVSLTQYVPIGIGYVRFMLIALPALGPIIGFGIADALDLVKGKPMIHRSVVSIILIALVGVLFLNSLVIIQYINLSQSKYVYPLIQIGNFAKTLPANAILYQYPILPLDVDMQYRYTPITAWGPLYLNSNCSGTANDSYIIMYPNVTMETACNLTQVFVPSPAPPELVQYDLFDNYGFGTYYNLTVYYHK
jgi:hypothetical protein